MSLAGQPARILIATNEQFWSSVEKSLAGYDLTFVPHIRTAKALMHDSQFDLLLIGIFFDDSRGVELITDVRLKKLNTTIPIVAVRLKDSPNNEILDQILTEFVEAKLADTYIEGAPTTVEVQNKLRLTVEGYLPKDKLV